MSASAAYPAALEMAADHGVEYQAHHVSKAFSSVPVLKDVSVSFHPGEIHSLLGENGAGSPRCSRS